MKKYIWLVLSLLLMSLQLQAEVFTKNHGTIKYNLKLEKAVDVELKFKFTDVAQLNVNASHPRVSIYSAKRIPELRNSYYHYLDYSFKENSKTLNVPLKAGNYVIELDGGAYYNKPFDFKLTKISGNFELEYNDKVENATPLIEKKFFTGYLQSKSRIDTDVYKISLKNNGILDLVFKATEKCKRDDKGYEAITLVKYSKEKPNDPISLIRQFSVNKDFRKTIGLYKGDYYLQIRSNYHCIYNKEYNLAYLETPTAYTELEPNGKEELATPIKTDGYYYEGKINSGYDEFDDFFTFNIKEKQDIIFSFKQPNFTTDFVNYYKKKINPAKFSIRVFSKKNGKYKYINKFDISLEESMTKKVVQKVASLEKGKYYIDISGIDFSGSVGDPKSGSDFMKYAIALIKVKNRG